MGSVVLRASLGAPRRYAALAVLGASAACATEAPDVEVQPLIDTRDTTGPYQVRARATDDGAVRRVTLIHGVLTGGTGGCGTGDTVETQRVTMTPAPELAGVWAADIPGQPPQTTLVYAVQAEDDQGNTGCGPAEVCPPTDQSVLLHALRFCILPP